MSVVQNKKCGKCEKVVYPAEEIKCLDKVSYLCYCSLFFILLCHLDIRQKGKSHMDSSSMILSFASIFCRKLMHDYLKQAYFSSNRHFSLR